MMDSTKLAHEIAKALSKILDEEIDPTNLGAKLVDAYAADSMDVVDIVDRMERTYKIEIPNSDIASLVSFGDVVAYVAERLRQDQ